MRWIEITDATLPSPSGFAFWRFGSQRQDAGLFSGAPRESDLEQEELTPGLES